MWELIFEDGSRINQVQNNKLLQKIDPNDPPKQVNKISYRLKNKLIISHPVVKGAKPIYFITRICTISGELINSIIHIGFVYNGFKWMQIYDENKNCVNVKIEKI